MKNTILLVEDDDFIRDSMSRLLQQEGYDMVACSCLEDARFTLRKSIPDLIILDVLLPDGSGFDLCREIRESYKTPVLFLTCCDQDEETVKGFDCGGDDYVHKPFRAKVLLARLKALLRRSQMEQGVNFNLDVFQFDNDKRICRLDGKVVALTPIEYRLLFELAKSANHVVGRETLLHAIWDIEFDYLDENILSVHISRLRSKLGQYSRKLITVRGEGYVLRCQNE